MSNWRGAFQKDGFVKRGEEFVYPSEKDIVKGLTLKAGLLPGVNKTKEFFRIIATKNPINFPPDMFKEGIGLHAYSTESGSLRELLKEMVTIPSDERIDSYIAYEVVR